MAEVPSEENGASNPGLAIPKKPLVLEVRIFQAKAINAKKGDPYVMVKVGGDEIYRTKTAHKTKDPVWKDEYFAIAKYSAEEDGPLYFELAAGDEISGVIGRGLVPLDITNAHKCKQQPLVWVKVAGASTPKPTELQVSVLAVEPIKEGELTFVKTKAPIKAVLVQDLLLIFNDAKEGRQLRHRIPLGTGSQFIRTPGSSDFKVIEDPNAISISSAFQQQFAKEEIILRAANENEANEWEMALKPYIGKLESPYFGTSVADILERERAKSGGVYQTLPLKIEELLDSVSKLGVKEPGIFRLGGTENELEDAVRRIEVGGPVIAPWESVHISASLVKRFLRFLPQSLLPLSFLSIPTRDMAIMLEQLKVNVWQMPEQNREMLKVLMCLAKQIQLESKENMMDAKNLSVVLGPCLLWQPETPSQAPSTTSTSKKSASFTMETLGALTNASKVCALTEALITYYDVIFEGAAIPTTVQKRVLNIKGVKEPDEVTRQSIEIFSMYETDNCILESGFLAFTEDLAAMPKAKTIPAADAKKFFAGLVKDKKQQPQKVTRDDFLAWWKKFHHTFLPA